MKMKIARLWLQVSRVYEEGMYTFLGLNFFNEKKLFWFKVYSRQSTRYATTPRERRL